MTKQQVIEELATQAQKTLGISREEALKGAENSYFEMYEEQ